MGRGLSDLQKNILTMAYHNSVAGNGHTGTGGADLYACEILSHVFGFGELPNAGGKLARRGGGHNFSLSSLGKSRYSAAHVSVSRACTRLAARGLVYCVSGAYAKWSGVNLTEQGTAIARELSVNTQELIPKF